VRTSLCGSPAASNPTSSVLPYKNSSYATGGIRRFSGSESNYGRYVYGAPLKFGYCWVNCKLNDSVSSIKNRGNHMNTAHYRHKNYVGYEFRLKRGYQIDLYGLPSNNALSSHKWVWW